MPETIAVPPRPPVPVSADSLRATAIRPARDGFPSIAASAPRRRPDRDAGRCARPPSSRRRPPSRHSFLAALIGRYREDHPHIDIEITEGTARDAIMQLRADRLDIVFVAGNPELPDCHTRRIWTEPLLAALPERHPLAERAAIVWADLAGETFLVRHGGTGPQAHDHIVLRLAGRWPTSSIQRFDVERGTLLSMVGQGFGITIVGAATALLPTSGVVFVPVADEPEPIPFSAVWSPFNQGAALRNLLDLARGMGRTEQSGSSRCDPPRPVA